MGTDAISQLRQRMIEDMSARQLHPLTQKGHIRACKRFAAFLQRSPDTATSDDLRRFQLHLAESGVSICNRNRTVTALRFLFHRIRHYGLFASSNRAANIARARELLGAAPRLVEPEEKKTAAPDEPRVLPCPCPRCGGRMIVIEVFARGCQPTYRPTPAPTPIRIDTS